MMVIMQQCRPVQLTTEQLQKMEAMKQQELRNMMNKEAQNCIHQYVRHRIVSVLFTCHS